MSFYRSKLTGDLVEAARFKGGHVNADTGLAFETAGDISWVCAAMNDKTLELSALGSALVLNFRGGSYGLAPGDWVIRQRGGDLVPCVGTRFEHDYEAVA